MKRSQQDGDGFVSAADVTEVMNSLGRVPTEDESEFMFELLQIVEENGFAFEAFVKLMLNSADFIADLGKSVATWQPKNVCPLFLALTSHLETPHSTKSDLDLFAVSSPAFLVKILNTFSMKAARG